MPISDEDRGRCSNNALQCYGTATIFERRAAMERWKLRILAFLGIAVPASLGGIATTFGVAASFLPLAITITGVLGITQLIISIWSLVASWGENFSYYLESKSANYRLAEDFINLARTTKLSPEEFEIELRGVETEGSARTNQDERYDITAKEKRRGMRGGLRKYERACATCKKIPTSLKPSECDTCGNY